jgi:ribonuclease R
MLNDAAIVSHISKLPHSRANFKQLVRELGVKGDSRNDLEAALSRLTARGELIELKSGQYVVTTRTREFAVGRLNLHRDGYGFLISERPVPGVTGDIFIPPEAAEKAMHGDRVIVRIARIEAGGRADGDIVKVLKRAHPTVVGEFKIGRRGCYVVPADGRIHQWIDIPDGMELPPANAPAVDRIGVTALKVASVAGLEGMVVNVERWKIKHRRSAA